MDLSIDSTQLQVLSIAVSLREIGYDIEVGKYKDFGSYDFIIL